MKLFNSKKSKSRLLNAKKIIQTSAFEVLTCFKKKQIIVVVYNNLLYVEYKICVQVRSPREEIEELQREEDEDMEDIIFEMVK